MLISNIIRNLRNLASYDIPEIDRFVELFYCIAPLIDYLNEKRWFLNDPKILPVLCYEFMFDPLWIKLNRDSGIFEQHIYVECTKSFDLAGKINELLDFYTTLPQDIDEDEQCLILFCHITTLMYKSQFYFIPKSYVIKRSTSFLNFFSRIQKPFNLYWFDQFSNNCIY